MKQKRFFIALCVTLLSLTTSQAQCTMNNTAFQSGEYLTYNLYFNWKFVWVKVGVASMSTVKSNYQGKEAYRCSLITRGNGKLDAVFTMRDTLLSYLSTQLVPLYFRKGAEEGKHYTIDEVFYTYTSDRCNMRLFRKKDNNPGKWTNASDSRCVVDMLNLFIRARNFDNSKWQPGYTLKLPVADGNGVEDATLKYNGKETIKGDNGVKYRCLKLTYTEYSKRKRKWRELATFYVTDDANHIPVRIDMNLNFGSAKAFVTNIKGNRNAITATTK